MKANELIRIRRQRAKEHQSAKGWRLLRLSVWLVIFVWVSALLLMSTAYVFISNQLPSISSFRELAEHKAEPSRFYERNGEEVLLALQHRDFVSQDLKICSQGDDCFPQDFVSAVIADKDPDFYQNAGFSLQHFFDPEPHTLCEELVQDIYGRVLQEGINKAFLTRILAAEITHIYGREQVLTWYLNRAYFGQMAFGLDAAARIYLNKPGAQLSLAESILMSTILKSPALNPIDSQGAVRETFSSQTKNLREKGLLSPEQEKELNASAFIVYNAPATDYRVNPDPILSQALNTAYNILGKKEVERGGFEIITTIDLEQKNQLECLAGVPYRTDGTSEDNCPLENAAVRNDIQQEEVSALVVNAQNGQMLAAVEVRMDESGQRQVGSNFRYHQPGSTLTPFAALYDFRMGRSPSTMLWDLDSADTLAPAQYSNPDGKYHGPVRLREAINGDYLRPIAGLIQKSGPAAVWNLASDFGLRSLPLTAENSLIFSGGSSSVEELSMAYMPFATLGSQSGTLNAGMISPISIISVSDEDGLTYNLQPLEQRSLLEDDLAYLVHHVLSEEKQNFRWLERPAGTKIGRVVDGSGFWMVGYTPQIISTVWAGSANKEGSCGDENCAITLWQALMDTAHQDLRIIGWNRPDNVRQIMVCDPSGLLPNGICPDTVSEVFLHGNEPLSGDDLYASLKINKENQLLATRFTPMKQISEKVFMNVPQDAQKWAEENKIEMIPKEYDPIHEMSEGPIMFINPPLFDIYTNRKGEENLIPLKARIKLAAPIGEYQVSLGEGFYPDEWTLLCSGGEISNGIWQLCTLDAANLTPGLYDIRLTVISDTQSAHSADTYISVIEE